MLFYTNIEHILKASDEIQEEFINTVINPIYGYKGHYKDILTSLRYIPESSLFGSLTSAVDKFVLEHSC